jgi:hypothetical protein
MYREILEMQLADPDVKLSVMADRFRISLPTLKSRLLRARDLAGAEFEKILRGEQRLKKSASA